MPVFELDGKYQPEFRALPEIVQGFIEAMFFTNVSSGADMEDWFSEENQEGLHEGTIGGNLPSDVGFTELHPTAIANIVAFCEAFEVAAGDLLDPIRDGEIDGYDMTYVGHDLWYTSQGHGVGFWDRSELETEEFHTEYERLTALMVAAGYNTPDWQAALAERQKLVSLGDKLSNVCRHREANVWFADHVDNGNEPFVYCEIKF